jgi:hypothetical protein
MSSLPVQTNQTKNPALLKFQPAATTNIDATTNILEEDTGLVRYDEMCHAIAECTKIDQVQDIKNKARAMEIYAHQLKNTEAERGCITIRLRAERRMGELLKETKQTGERATGRDAGPGRGKKEKASGGTTPLTTLSSLGLSRDQSSRYQKLAEVPAKEFEEALVDPATMPSTEGIINRAAVVQSPPVIDAVPTNTSTEGEEEDEGYSPDALGPFTPALLDEDNAPDALVEFDPALLAVMENRERPTGKGEYIVTLHVAGSRLKSAQKQAEEAFGEMFLAIEADKPATSRAGRLSEAGDLAERSRLVVEELRDELQSWHDNIPENLQSGLKAAELEEAISSLEDLVSNLENLSFDIDIPGM